MKEEIIGDLRQVLKPYLGHWDVPEGGDLVLTIDKVYKEDVHNQHGTETKPVMYFREDVKPWIVNATNNKTLNKLLKRRTATNSWSGKKIALYAGEEPKSEDGFAIRVRPYLPKTDEIFCEDCGELITDHDKYKAKAIANNALTKFGRYLCWDCAQAAKAEMEGNE